MRLRVALLVLAIVGGCHSSGGDPNSVGGQCQLGESPNGCVRCWAQKCSTQLDYCFGPGFHSGQLVSAAPGGSSAPCFAYSRCLQLCGCYDRCFDTCVTEVDATCNSCQQKYFLACRTESCAAECSPPDGGGQ